MVQITLSQSVGSKTLILVRYCRDLRQIFPTSLNIQLFEFYVMSNKKTLIASHLRDFQIKPFQFYIQSNSKILIATNLKTFSSNSLSFVS